MDDGGTVEPGPNNFRKSIELSTFIYCNDFNMYTHLLFVHLLFVLMLIFYFILFLYNSINIIS